MGSPRTVVNNSTQTWASPAVWHHRTDDTPDAARDAGGAGRRPGGQPRDVGDLLADFAVLPRRCPPAGRSLPRSAEARPRVPAVPPAGSHAAQLPGERRPRAEGAGVRRMGVRGALGGDPLSRSHAGPL